MKRTPLHPESAAPVRKGVLDRDQYMLTPKQREYYNQFRQQGISDKVARQLAVAIAKSGRDMTPPQAVRDAARKGLDQMGEFGGAGLTEGAKARARGLAAGKPISAQTAQRMVSFHARHGAQQGSLTDDNGDPTPKAVAHNLWGGKAGERWAKTLTEAKDDVRKGQKPLGAAFARARAKQKEKGGSLKGHANDYLKEKGHSPIGKALAALRAVRKGGPGSGPQGGDGTSHDKAVAALKDRIKELRARGDTGQASELTSKVAQLAQRMAQAAIKKSYSRAFVQSAKDALPQTYFRQLHTSARAKAGGTASGMARRALADAEKAQLMQRRGELQAELAQIDLDLKKTAPLVQEVAVDAPVKIAPKEKKRREKLAKDLVAEALDAAKSCPAGKERVTVQVAGTLCKSAQPDWKRIVHSVVYAPGDVDAHGDYMHAEDIEKMAHDAMRTGLYVNHEHEAEAIEADVVESYIAPQDFNLELPGGEPYHIPKGSHVMAMHVWGDEPWAKIQAGEYVGYSLEGTALRDVA